MNKSGFLLSEIHLFISIDLFIMIHSLLPNILRFIELLLTERDARGAKAPSSPGEQGNFSSE